MGTSKAAVFMEPLKPLEIQEFPIPEVEPGAVLVQMQMAAVCGSDVHKWHDSSAKGPMIFGHENVGSVAQIGRGVVTDALGRPLKEGDRVVFRAAPCGRCPSCTQGLTCSVNLLYGYIPSDKPPYIRGGFSQYIYLDPSPWVLKVPDEMSTERALLAVIGNHTTLLGLEKIGGIHTADTVVVQGAGPIGMGGLVQSKISGASRVIVIGGPESRLDLAKEIGADDTVNIDDYPTPEARIDRIRELTGSIGPDMVIECSGAPSAVQEGLEMVRPGGKYLVLGQATDYGQQPINPSLITRKAIRVEGAIAGVAPYSYIVRSLEAMNSVVSYPVEKLITHRYVLEDINDAFKAHESYEAMIPVVLPNG
ncbi:MAG: zinc-binding dehydrogenase [Chloroflexi bacterium]|nr:zinc-binding dehydrogenase [Chloroflexota bacterium]